MNPLRPLPLLALALLGCPVSPANDKADDTGSGGYRETGDVEETGETGDTAGDTADSAEDTAVDTAGDTADTGEEIGLAALVAWPARLVVNPGATYSLRVVAEQKSGERDVYTTATFASDDATIADVDAAGLVTAMGEGTTTLRVAAEGLETTVEVEVRAAMEARVTILNASTGLPIEKASVWNADVEYKTDASGLAVVAVTTAGPTTFTTWKDIDTAAISLVDTVNREITLSVPVVADLSPTAQLHGPVDFAGVEDASFGEEVFGLAAASVQGDLPLFEIDDLLGPNRTLTYYGVNVDVPSNLFVEGYLDDYYAGAWPGSVGVWGLGGPVAISDLSAGLNGTGDAMALIIDNIDRMSWGGSIGYVATAGSTTEAPLAPATAFSATAHLALPSLSSGFDGTEEQLVCTFDETPDGYLLTGLGLGAGVLDIDRIPTGSVSGATGSAVWTMAQVGGIGSGGGVAISVADDDGGTVTFPDFQDVPTIDAWTPSSRELQFTVDPDATFVRVTMEDNDGVIHYLYFDGSWTGLVEKHNWEFQRNNADVFVESYTILEGNLEEWIATGTLDPEGLGVTTVSRNRLVK
jgi:hypothetical protein